MLLRVEVVGILIVAEFVLPQAGELAHVIPLVNLAPRRVAAGDIHIDKHIPRTAQAAGVGVELLAVFGVGT